LFKTWPGDKVSVNSGIISLSRPPLFSTAYNAWQFRWQPQVQEIQGKGSYLDVHLRKQKRIKKIILWSVQKLVDSTTVCLTENAKIQLYDEKLFLLELSKMNMKVGLFHPSDNVLDDNKNSCKATLEQN
jgi:hypothetical protein